MIDFGIVQGRLIQSPPGELQWFPGGQWPEEFQLAQKNGINFIELLVERELNNDNPIWSETGRKSIKKAASNAKRKLYTTCTDYIINHGILGQESDSVKQHVFSYLDATASMNCKAAIFPLLEASNIDVMNMQEFVPSIRSFAAFAADRGLMIYLETLLNAKDLNKFLDQIDEPNVFCVFDTGNRVLESSDLASEIILLDRKIKHVHIKDKNSEGENVLLGTGMVDFFSIFQALSKIDYSGSYVFETTRGANPISTVKYHMEFCNFFFNEANRN